MKLVIPQHWSVEQADAVLELIDMLESAIWDTYEKPLVELAIRQANEPIQHDDDFTDDAIPF